MLLLVVQVQSLPVHPVDTGIPDVKASSVQPMAAPVVFPNSNSLRLKEGVALGESTLEPGSAPLIKPQVRLPTNSLPVRSLPADVIADVICYTVS